MNIKLDSLVSYEAVMSDAESVFEIVDKNGKAVVIRNNHPAYIILKYEMQDTNSGEGPENFAAQYKLHEAMKKVLLEKEDHTMHAADLAEEVYQRGLYYKKNGGKAEAVQIRARCSNYKEWFEPLPGNFIRIKAGAE